MIKCKILFLSLTACIATGLQACDNTRGLDTTETTSAQFKSLAEKVVFLETYVSFRRTYENSNLISVIYNNRGGMVPGPSDWNIRIIAKVPENELKDWTRDISITATPDLSWLSTLPTGIDYRGISMWYKDDYRIIGVDEANGIIAYQNATQ